MKLEQLRLPRAFTHGEGERIKHRVRMLTASLHDLLADGYGLRVIADYEPDVLVVHHHGDLLLQNITLAAAANWPDRAERFLRWSS